MTEKYRGEFGSSPTLLDDTIADPALMARWEECIPDLNSRPSDERRFLGDLCKIDGVIHMWFDDKWWTLDELNARQFRVQA